MEDVLQMFYFNKNVLASIAKELRRASWGLILLAFAVGHQVNKGEVLVLGSGLWCLLQILAFVLESIDDGKGDAK